VLVVSYIGYQTREIIVSAANSQNLTVAMVPAQSRMGEVVITKSTTVQSRTLMLYQYMPWPIDRLFK